MIVYKIDVLKALKDAGYNTNRLRQEKVMGEWTIQALRKGEPVTMITLDKVCGMLGLQPGDIIGYAPDGSDVMPP